MKTADHLGNPVKIVSRTVYWKAVRDLVTKMGGKRYSHTYIRECANGIKSCKAKTINTIITAQSKLSLLPKKRITHEHT